MKTLLKRLLLPAVALVAIGFAAAPAMADHRHRDHCGSYRGHHAHHRVYRPYPVYRPVYVPPRVVYPYYAAPGFYISGPRFSVGVGF